MHVHRQGTANQTCLKHRAGDRCLHTNKEPQTKGVWMRATDWCLYSNKAFQSHEFETEGWVQANRLMRGLNSTTLHSMPPLPLFDFKRMFSALLASRNCIPDSVLSKDLSVCVIGLCSRMHWHRIAAAAAAAAAAFWGGRGFPAAWRQRFPHARQKIWPSFQRFFESCAPYSWYSTVGLEDCKHTLSKFSSNDEP